MYAPFFSAFSSDMASVVGPLDRKTTEGIKQRIRVVIFMVHDLAFDGALFRIVTAGVTKALWRARLREHWN
jgi:hypothetical protein